MAKGKKKEPAPPKEVDAHDETLTSEMIEPDKGLVVVNPEAESDLKNHSKFHKFRGEN